MNAQNHEPIWNQTRSLKQYPPLSQDESTEVAIVGGGITGITAAYLLQKAGKQVTLVDQGRLLNGTTLHTTAKITAQHGLIYDQLINSYNYQTSRHYYEANLEAMQLIQSLIQDEQINCDLQQHDAYLYTESTEGVAKIEKEFEAYDRLNINSQLADSIPFNLEIEKALIMKDQWQFNPTAYLSYLIQRLDQGSTKLYEHTAGRTIEEKSVIMEDNTQLTADRILICTHFPFYTENKLFSTRLHAEKSYVIAFPTADPYPGGMYLNIDSPKRSIRETTINDQSYILFGGEGHKVGQGEDMSTHYEALKRDAKAIFSKQPIDYQWSTQDLVTVDKIPYIGPVSKEQPHILLATGYRKWGMTNGTAAAKMMTDDVLNKPDPKQNIFSPSRSSVTKGLTSFIKENTDVTKHLLKDKLSHPKGDLESLNPGQATTMLLHGQRKGVYKADSDQLYIVDTTCTHAGCEVNWNSAENTWDCPCHGSRFTCKGEVIEGPAKENLHHEQFSIIDLLKLNASQDPK
ncbi:FAD-dependent oxidoreductase [Alkalibacillus sp. S2W]|uniref:FAD-dependent oxidoreductase n=1 Tax=Alkalibacillus sp. S2W TaxID=3386553 RepID=UPI00398CCEA6